MTTCHFCVYLHHTNGKLLVNALRFTNQKILNTLRRMGAVIVEQQPFVNNEHLQQHCDDVTTRFSI